MVTFQLVKHVTLEANEKRNGFRGSVVVTHFSGEVTATTGQGSDLYVMFIVNNSVIKINVSSCFAELNNKKICVTLIKTYLSINYFA